MSIARRANTFLVGGPSIGPLEVQRRWIRRQQRRGGYERHHGPLQEEQLMDQWPAEVWNQYTQSWAPGFEVIDDTERGFRIRRRSDGSVLPRDIAKQDVRAEG